jgi:hypothetical protein
LTVDDDLNDMLIKRKDSMRGFDGSGPLC